MYNMTYLDREVVLVQLVEVEGAEKRLGTACKSSCANKCREVRSDIHSCCKTCDQAWNRKVLAVAIDEAVVGQSIESLQENISTRLK